MLACLSVSALGQQSPPNTAPGNTDGPASRENAAERISQLAEPGDGKADTHGLLPDAFRVPTSEILPIGNTEYPHSVGGKEWRRFRMWRVAETANQPHRYFVWPVPQLSRNLTPLKGLPDFIFAATPPDAMGRRSVQLQVDLMSNDMCQNPLLIDAIWALDGMAPDSYLQKRRITKDQLRVSPFPVTHGFVDFTIGGEEVLIAKTSGSLGAVPSKATIWVVLTRDQINTLAEAMKDQTLEMTWRFQYTGAAPVLMGGAQARMTADMITQAAAGLGLSPEQQSGQIPLFDQRECDRVAQRVLTSMRVNTTANSPDALLFLNIEALLPRLFDLSAIEGDQLAKFVDDPAKRAALAQYLVPHIRKEVEERGHHSAKVVVDTTTKSHSSDGGGTFSVPLVGLSIGGSDAEAEQVAHSVTESTGNTIHWNRATSKFEATRIRTFTLKDFSGNADQVVSQELYVVRDPNKRFYYVVDSPIVMSRFNVYDELRANAVARQEADAAQASRLAAWRETQLSRNIAWNAEKVVEGPPLTRKSPKESDPVDVDIDKDGKSDIRLKYIHFGFTPTKEQIEGKSGGKDTWESRAVLLPPAGQGRFKRYEAIGPDGKIVRAVLGGEEVVRDSPAEVYLWHEGKGFDHARLYLEDGRAVEVWPIEATSLSWVVIQNPKGKKDCEGYVWWMHEGKHWTVKVRGYGNLVDPASSPPDKWMPAKSMGGR